MAKVVSQETFDDVVRENIVEFSMNAQEAQEETIKQFETQGVNLANIIKDLSINEETGIPLIKEAIDKLKSHLSLEQRLEKDELISILAALENQCDQSIPHRVLGGKLEAQSVLLRILEDELNQSTTADSLVVLQAILCANSLTNKQPDIFDAESLAIIIKILQKYRDHEKITPFTLQWIGKSCIMHEKNRQNIMNCGILENLKPLITSRNENIIRDLCIVFRYLVLDDDIRVDFGKAHDHARHIAGEVLYDLTKLLKEFNDINTICELLLTIASLTVRNEFCVTVEEAGGLNSVIDVLNKNPNSLRLSREALKLLKSLAGHDAIKENIVKQGAAPIIHCILDTHKQNESLAKVALVCISTLTLRSQQNSTAFFDSGIPEAIVETIRLHPKSKQVLRNGAWAIRNMVSRSREQCDLFLTQGVEELLNNAMIEHPSIQQDLKAALRDLGCKVQLNEEWTGKSEKKISY